MGVVMFSSAFSSAFVRAAVEYIGPMSAMRELTDGAAWHMRGAGVVIAGRVLIGPAGKIFAFGSPENAVRWVDNARGAGVRERAVIAGIAPETAAAYKEKKRVKLAIIAGRLVTAAGRQSNAAKRAALLAESDYCLSKWGTA